MVPEPSPHPSIAVTEPPRVPFCCQSTCLMTGITNLTCPTAKSSPLVMHGVDCTNLPEASCHSYCPQGLQNCLSLGCSNWHKALRIQKLVPAVVFLLLESPRPALAFRGSTTSECQIETPLQGRMAPWLSGVIVLLTSSLLGSAGTDCSTAHSLQHKRPSPHPLSDPDARVSEQGHHERDLPVLPLQLLPLSLAAGLEYS